MANEFTKNFRNAVKRRLEEEEKNKAAEKNAKKTGGGDSGDSGSGTFTDSFAKVVKERRGAASSLSSDTSEFRGRSVKGRLREGEFQPTYTREDGSTLRGSDHYSYVSEMNNPRQQEDEQELRDATLWDLTVNSFNRGYYSSRLGEENFQNLMGAEGSEAEKYRQILQQDEYNFETDKLWQQGVSGVAQQLGQQLYQYADEKSLAAGFAAAGAAWALGKAGPQALFPEEFATVPAAFISAVKKAGAAGAMAKGMQAGATVSNLQIEAGLAFEEMMELGIDPDIAKAAALSVGGVNAVIEGAQLKKLEDAYTTLVKANASDSLVKRIGKILAERGVDVAKETGQEVVQEAVTMGGVTAANLADKGEAVYTGEDWKNRLSETALSSALTFGLMNAPAGAMQVAGATATDRAQKYATKQQENAAIAPYEGKPEVLINEVLALDPENEVAWQVHGQLESDVTAKGHVSRKQMVRLVSERDRLQAENAVAENKQEREQAAEEESIPPVSSADIPPLGKGGKAQEAADVKTDKAETKAVEAAAAQKKETEPAAAVSESGKASFDGEDVDIESVSAMGKGRMTFKLADGRTVASDGLLHANEDDALVYGTVAEVASDAGKATTIAQGFQDSGMKATAYTRAVRLAHMYGKNGVPIHELGKSSASYLSEDVRMAAYKSGQKAGGLEIAQAQAVVKSGQKTAVGGGVSMLNMDGKTEDFRSYMAANSHKQLSAMQESGVVTAEALNKAYGVGFVFYESYERGGNRFFVDEDGVEKDAPNGFYRKGGRIYVDLNAGNAGNGLVLYTESHELSHFVREWSPAKWKVLANEAAKQLSANGKDVRELVAKQMEKAEAAGHELSYEDAYEEVIADAMEGIMADGKVMRQVMDSIKEQDRSLWEKMTEWLKDAIAKLKELVNAYKGVKPDSAEGQAIAEMKGALDTLEQLYAEALMDAGESFKSNLAELDIAIDEETHKDAKYSGREATKNTTDDGGVKYSIRRTSQMSLSEQLKAYYNGEMASSDAFYFGETSIELQRSGIDPLPLAMTIRDFQKSTKTKHNVPRRVLTKLSLNLASPLFSFGEGNRVGFVVDDIDGDGNQLLIAIQGGAIMDREAVNTINSIYGIGHPNEWVKNQINSGKQFVLYNEKKANAFLQTYGYVASVGDGIRLAENKVTQNSEEVKMSARDSEYLSAVEEAEKQFGTTNDFAEAGFILPNGKLLRFTDDAHSGERQYDHRAIGLVYGVDVDLSKNRGFNKESNKHLDDFVEEGGIRFFPGDLEMNMDAGLQLSGSKPLTREQEQSIREFIEWKKQREDDYNPAEPSEDFWSLYSGPLALHIDFGAGANSSVFANKRASHALSYEGGQINADRIIADIRHYYRTGETRKPSEVAQFRYSQRNPLTDHEVLKRAANGLNAENLTDAEQDALRIFKKRLDKLEALQDHRKKLGDEYRKARKEGDREKVQNLKKRMDDADRDIEQAQNEVLRVEQTEVLRRVLKVSREVVESDTRQRVYDKEKKKFEAKEAKIRKEYAQRREQAAANRKDSKEKKEMRMKIRKTVRQLDKLLNRGDKKRNVKEDMREMVSAVLKSADVLFTDELSDDDLLRNGIGTELSDGEQVHLEEALKYLGEIDRVRSRIDELSRQPATAEVVEEISRLKEQIGELGGEDAKHSSLRGKYNYRKRQLKDVFARERARLNKAKVSDVMNELAEAYGKLQKSDEAYVSVTYSDTLHQYIQWVRDEIGGTLIKDMSVAQLEEVHKVYTMVLTTVRDANKLFDESIKENREQVATRVINEVHRAGRRKDKWTKAEAMLSIFGWNNLKPVYAFERLGSGTLMQLFKNIRKGEDVWAVNMQEADAFRKQVRDKYGYDGWDLEKTHSFTSSSGIDFTLTVEQMMSLYAYSKREAAADHLQKGGFVFGKNTEVVENKNGVKFTYLKKNATAHSISHEVMQEIVGKLSEEQIGFVDEMQEYLSTTMGNKGNEVSLKLFGVKQFGEKFYFPIRSAGQYLAKAKEEDFRKQQGQVNLVSSGFTKALTPKASNPIILSNFSDLWAEHVNEMSMYHAFVLPLEDFRKVYGYSLPNVEAGETVSVNSTIENAFGDAATAYIDQLLKDINGGAISDPRENIGKRMVAQFKKAAVFASMSVVIQQPMSVGRAFAEIDPKFFLGERMSEKKHRRVWEEVKRYAPVAVIKEMGYFDTGMGRSAREYLTSKEYKGFKEKAKALVTDANFRDEWLWLGRVPALADELAWCMIWDAVKRETKARNMEMDVRSEEFLQLCGERFTDVITKTQVYDSVLARSAFMRSKGAYMSMATSFMAEPTTVANMVESAVWKLRKGDKDGAKRQLGAVLVSTIMTAAAVSLVYGVRDDDEDESFVEKYVSAFASEMMDSLNPLTYLPFVKDAWSILQGYDVERADMSLISDLSSAMTNVVTLSAKDTSYMDEAALDDHNKQVRDAWLGVADYMAAMFGLPVKNLRRDFNAAKNVIKMMGSDVDTTWGSLVDKTWDSVRRTLPVIGWMPAETKQDKLYDAIMAGDTVYADRLKSGYKDQSAADSAVRKGLRNNDPRIREAAIAWNKGDNAAYMRIAKEIVAEKKFSQDDIVKAIRSEAEALAPDEAQASGNKHVGLFNMEAFGKALLQNNSAMAKTIKTDLINTEMRNGKSRDDAEKGFVSSVRSEVKDLYNDGEISDSRAISALVTYGDKTESKAASTVAYWNFEKEHPTINVEDAWIDEYYSEVEDSGMDIGTFVEYRNRVKDIKGSGMKKKRLAVIDSMPISNAQKDALYYAEGWAASRIREAPWH